MIFAQETREKSRFESSGQITIQGQPIPYRTVCEDNFILGSDGEPAGSIFSYAYFRSDIADPSTRPVLFAYNGGPGCSSLWLHLGLFGPRRLKLGADELSISPVPPFELEDNPGCLLDLCDIVMVDPVGTGYGRLFNEAEKAGFYGADADIYSLGLFIDGWLTRYGRHNSPVLLAGESYGTGRSALLVGELLGAGPERPEVMGISVSGVMLLGSHFMTDLPVEKSVLGLYSMAATNWYHNREGKPELREFLEEAWEFSSGAYLKALFLGDELTGEEREAMVDQLHYFSGVSKNYLRDHNLRVVMREYSSLVLEDQHKVVGFYDSRYTWDALPDVKDANVIADDAAMGQYTPAFLSAMALLRKELGITFERSMKGLSMPISKEWERKPAISPADSLAGSMRRNNRLRIFFATGIYDLATTAGNARYLASHSNLDPERVTRREYPSGHMAYLGEESFAMLTKDMRDFFTAALYGDDGAAR